VACCLDRRGGAQPLLRWPLRKRAYRRQDEPLHTFIHCWVASHMATWRSFTPVHSPDMSMASLTARSVLSNPASVSCRMPRKATYATHPSPTRQNPAASSALSEQRRYSDVGRVGVNASPSKHSYITGRYGTTRGSLEPALAQAIEMHQEIRRRRSSNCLCGFGFVVCWIIHPGESSPSPQQEAHPHLI
jgi:hypothetical protein